MVAGKRHAPQQPETAVAEPPDGSYAIATTERGASVVVREDDPSDPRCLERWRPVGRGRWHTWAELTSAGPVERLYTQAQVAAIAAATGPRARRAGPPTAKGGASAHLAGRSPLPLQQELLAEGVLRAPRHRPPRPNPAAAAIPPPARLAAPPARGTAASPRPRWWGR